MSRNVYVARSAEECAAEGEPELRSDALKGASLLLSRAIYLSLLALLVLTAIPYGSAEPWWIAVFAAAVFLLCALWMVEGALSGRWLVREHLLLIPPLALAAYSLIQTVSFGSPPISYDPYQTRLFALKLFALTMSYGLLVRYAADERRLRILIYTVVGLALATACFGLARELAQGGEQGFLLPGLSPGIGYAQFVNRNHFAFFMEMSLGLVVGLAAGDSRRERLLTYLAFLLVLLTALVMSKSRGGVVAVVAELLFVVALFPLRRRGADGKGYAPRWGGAVRSIFGRAALAGCLLLLLLVGIVWVGGEEVVGRFESSTSDFRTEGTKAGANTSRSDMWAATWRLFATHPVTGVGFGGYWMAVTETHRASGALTPQEAHNDYLELLASGGLVGAALFAWAVWAFARRAAVGLRRPDSFGRNACRGALTGLCGVAAHSVADFGLHITANALLMVVLVAVATVGGGRRP